MENKNIRNDNNMDVEIIDDFLLDEDVKPNNSNVNSLEQQIKEVAPNNNTEVKPTPQPLPNNNREVKPTPQPLPNNNREVKPIPQPLPNNNPEVKPLPQQMPRQQELAKTEPIPQPSVDHVETLGDNKVIEKAPKKKKKFNILIFIILAIILIAAAVYAYYWQVSSPKRLLVKGIEELSGNFEYFAFPLKNSTNKIEGNKNVMGNISLNVKLNDNNSLNNIAFEGLDNNFIDNINKTTISYNHQKDLNQNKELLSIISSLGGEELLSVEFLKSDNKYYFLLKNIFNKYILLEDMESLNTLDTKETIGNLNYIWSIVGKSIYTNIDNTYINIDKVNVNLDNDNVMLKKITLNLNNNNQQKLYRNILLNLKEDDKAVEIISSYYPEFKDMDIEQKITEVSEFSELLFSVYYKDLANTIVMTEINDIINNSKMVYKNTVEETIEFFKEDKSVSKIVIKKEKEDFVITAKISEKFILTVNGEQEEDNYSYTWDIINDNGTITGKYILQYETVTEGSEYNTISNFILNTAQDGKEIFSLEIINNGKVTNSGQITDVVNESVLLSELTNDELNGIVEKLFEIIAKILEKQA